MIKTSQKKGQVIVEWAIVLPLMMVTIFGICEWCLIEVAQNMTFDAAYKAARAELVHENPYDAAAISLFPIAGWTDELYASGFNDGEFEMIKTADTSLMKTLPGWENQPFSRSHRIVGRLDVQIKDNNWEKVSSEVVFYYELLFPFVDIFFADIQQRQADLSDTTVDHNEQTGIGTQHSSGDMGNPTLKVHYLRAKNFIELRANASVSRIDHPLSISNFDLNNMLGIAQDAERKQTMFDNPQNISEWTSAP